MYKTILLILYNEYLQKYLNSADRFALFPSDNVANIFGKLFIIRVEIHEL